MNHEDSRELLGAYALHAVESDEATLIEHHLASCPGCAQELSMYRECAVALGEAGDEAPPALWERIAAELDEHPPPLRLVRERPPAASWGRRSLAVAAAAAVAAVMFLGWDVGHLDGRVASLQSAMSKRGIVQAAAAAAVAPTSRHVVMRSPTGTALVEVVLVPGGQGYVLSGTLPSLPSGETYQLWGLTGKGVVSLGLLGRTAGPAAFRVGPETSKLMVTAEPAAGVPAPTSSVLDEASL